MATNYLLTCECGEQTAVQTRQAGGELTCQCGLTLAVPRLSELQNLPVEAPTADSTTGSSWGFRQGMLTAGLLLTAALAAGGGYVWSLEPPPPAEFDPVAREASIASGVETLTPADGYRMWISLYENLGQLGFQKFENRAQSSQLEEIKRLKIVRWALLGAAVAVGLTSVGLFSAIKPSN